MNLQTMAERFCAAPLPETVCADLISTRPATQPTTIRRTGTNLLTVEEAKAVLSHVMGGEVCTWTGNDDGIWTASCDRSKEFCFTEEGPEDNRFEYCPYCGKPLVAEPCTEFMDAE